MSLFLHTILFSKNFISQVKESAHFSMLEAKFWHNKTETKNVKIVNMAEFSKTCHQYPHRFNFGNFS